MISSFFILAGTDFGFEKFAIDKKFARPVQIFTGTEIAIHRK